MKVLQIIPSVSPCYGGTSEVFENICLSLMGLGVHVEVATTDASGTKNEPLPKLFIEKVKTHVFHNDFSENWKFSWAFKSWMAKNCYRFNLVHAHSVWSYLPSCGFRIAKKNNIPFFLSPHGMLSPYTFSRKPILKRIFWNFSEKAMISGASGFLGSSIGEAAEIKRFNSTAPVAVIHHGLPPESVTAPKEPLFLRKKFNIPNDVPILLFFSRIHPKKGLHDVLLPAFSKLKFECRLFIVGAEDPHCPGFEKMVRDQVKQMGLEKKATFLGAVSPSDRWRYFDSADLFLLPSIAENFGMVVVESLARGTPVVISDEVQASEIVLENGGGAVIKRDVETWVKTITDYFTCKPLTPPVYSMTWDNVGAKILDFYSANISSF